MQSGGGDPLVEFLGESDKRLGPPILAVLGSPNRYMEGFLLDHFRNFEHKQERFARARTQLQGRSLSRHFGQCIARHQILRR